MPIILPKCPDNYALVKNKCRCKKKTAKKKTIKKKTKKKSFIEKHKGSLYFKSAFEKQIKQKWKDGIRTEWVERYGPNKGRCRKGYMKNSEDKFCYTWSDSVLKKNTQSTKPKKTTKKKIKKKIKKKKTKKIKKTSVQKKKLLSSKLRSFSPSINRKIDRLSISPHKDMFGGCKENQIKVGEKCWSWKTKKATNFLLDNLKSKKPVVAENIIGPNQSWSNCWFNSFFMMFFISDKARKFMKSFRESMITGKITGTTKKIPDNLRYPFWLLNKFITASLVGKADPIMYASLIDTNDIIKGIYKKLKKYSNKNLLDYRQVTNIKEAGNPINMFLIIKAYFDYTQNSEFGVTTFNINGDYSLFSQMSKKNTPVYNAMKRNNYGIIIIEISDEHSNGKLPNGKQAKVSDFKKKLSLKFGNKEYKLDSIGIRNIKQNHICALLTINGDDYVFDGENHTPLYKRKWRDNLNENKTFKITPNIPEKYNLTKGYQCLIYYRTR